MLRSGPVALLCALSVPSIAAAQDVLEVELTPVTQAGVAQPRLTVLANATLDELRLELAGGGRRYRHKAGPLAAGEEHAFELALPKPGKVHLEGTLKVRVGQGGGEMPLAFDIELRSAIALQVEPDLVDLDKRQLELTSSAPLSSVRVSVLSEEGEDLGTTEVEARAGPEGRVRVRWKQSPGRVLRIDVRGEDAEGFYGSVSLYPWRVDIPHEDVVFESDSSEVQPSEVPKLKGSLQKLQVALTKYGKLASGLTLFVAGHTDTVGASDHNQRLSEARARAIARWFSSRVRVPIRFAGLGESALRVETPDETDEPRNRRAEYIVAVDSPSVGTQRPSWKVLKSRRPPR